MTDWQGVNRKVTPIGYESGVSEFQNNTRMRVLHELRRRPGMAASNLPNAGAAIVGLTTAFTANGPIIVRTTSTNVLQGDVNPLPQWGDIILKPPIVGGVLPDQNWSFGPYSYPSLPILFVPLPANAKAGTVTFVVTNIGQGSTGAAAANLGPLGTTGCVGAGMYIIPVPLHTVSITITIANPCGGIYADWTVFGANS